MTESCSSCRYFRTNFGAAGRCHRHAPRHLFDSVRSPWAGVNKADWCGEYEEKPEPRLDEKRDSVG